MASQPATIYAQMYLAVENEMQDPLHLINKTGVPIGWIDSNGLLKGSLSPLNYFPGSVFYVDKNRTDAYTANGTVAQPFKSIMAAVNQVVANGDNSNLKPYLIDIVGGGIYNETIDLSATGLVSLSIEGHSDVTIGGQTAAGICLQAYGNPGLSTLIFSNLIFINVDFKLVDFVDAANTGTFLNNGFTFFNCTFEGSELVADTIHFQNACTGEFYRCQITSPTNITVDNNPNGGNTAFFFSTFNTLGTLKLMNGAIWNQRGGGTRTNIVVDATSELVSHQGEIGEAGTTFVIAGSVILYGVDLQANVTVMNNGTLDTRGIHYSGSITVNPGGTWTTNGLFAANGYNLNGTLITQGLGSPNGTVTGNPGDLYLNTAGGSGTTLYVKESGSGTNTGWVGK